ncbi:MAG: RdgB/HAM1 family non-canonical purine NTP pyrophosphatase [Rickettsia endosymbiont of Ixodes persulcatus]|nr:RdgB/HAM1 family non-canonical purine NTP pyrophosphatase [Rickettsia endosymbiont of Ixodes persulcatus]
MKIVLATTNEGKIREFSAILHDLPIQLLLQSHLNVQEIEETGLSFIENALLKARHAARITGLPALADDSGIAVNALRGAPGIFSARYAGKTATANDNIKKLLHELENARDKKRDAAFYCVLAFVAHANDPTPLICTGKWTGTILHEAKGTDGFGYDPIFYVATEKKSAAELSPEIKNKISHRAKALQSLIQLLPEKLHESALG